MPDAIAPASTTTAESRSVAPFSPVPFGKYWLIERIATGGMAEIFLAKSFSHGGFESTFVVKRILPDLGVDAGFIDLFVTEAKVSVGLQHPNIVRVFDFGRHDDRYFIAMEHIGGRDLRRLLRVMTQAGEPLPLPLALYIASEACKGLHFAHTRTGPDGAALGIVHRDISPSNLLLSWDGDVKLADFGIARADWAAGDDEGVKGKYEYMSPEQADGRAIDARSDLFSLGVTLYEMVTGQRAFKGKDDAETLRRLAAVDLARPSGVVPGLPDVVEQIILRALAPMPAARFASAREMGEALRKAMEPVGDDAAREQLAGVLRARFAAEISEDAGRLEARTRLAQAKAAELAHTVDTLVEVEGPPTSASDAMHGRLIGGLVVALVGMLALLGMVWWNGQQTVAVPEIAVAAMGSLEVAVTPKAKVYISGRLAGESETFAVSDLAPGDYEVRLEAEGYRSVVETVRITRGGATHLKRELAAIGADAPTVEIGSRPPGATVVINGAVAGTTPLAWKEGEPGKAYDVELRLDGYVAARGRLEGLVAKETSSFTRALEKVAEARPDPRDQVRPEAKPETRPEPKPEPPPPPKEAVKPAAGSLKVVLMGATWATVYVDGRKLSRQAPFAAEPLPAGEHTIKVENPASGLSTIQKVTVTPGGTVTVRAVAQ